MVPRCICALADYSSKTTDHPMAVFTGRKRSCWKVWVLHLSVNHSFHTGCLALDRGVPLGLGVYTPLVTHPVLGQTPCLDTPPVTNTHTHTLHTPHFPWTHTSPWTPPSHYGQQADSTHPTGMLSCTFLIPKICNACSELLAFVKS